MKLEKNESYEGISIEEKMREMLECGEPLEGGSPMIYTDKKDGVLPQYDIRTDRFDIALDAVDKINQAKIAKSKEIANVETKPNDTTIITDTKTE